MKKYIEIHKVKKDKLNLIFFKDGDAYYSKILSPSDYDCNNVDELIGMIRTSLQDLEVNYQIYR